MDAEMLALKHYIHDDGDLTKKDRRALQAAGYKREGDIWYHPTHWEPVSAGAGEDLWVYEQGFKALTTNAKAYAADV